MNNFITLADIYDRMLAEDLKRDRRVRKALNKTVKSAKSQGHKDCIQFKRPVEYIRES